VLRRKGKHRGKYQPNWHWSHISCHPWGCHVGTHKVELKVYQDYDIKPEALGLQDEFTTIRFTKPVDA
jgi:hypothetical protein